MPPRKNPRTKKERASCKECGGSMDSEHAAAKTCLACREPEPDIAPTIGETVGEPLQHSKVPQTTFMPFFLIPGDEVSINLKQRKFLICKNSGWELNPRKWSGSIPNDIDLFDLKSLRIALEAGDIVKGKVFTGIEKDITTMTKAATVLKKDEITLRKSLGLIVQHKGLVGGYIPYEIFRYLIRFEDDNEHRKRVLDFLQNALDHLKSGPPKSTPVLTKTIEEVTGLKF